MRVLNQHLITLDNINYSSWPLGQIRSKEFNNAIYPAHLGAKLMLLFSRFGKCPLGLRFNRPTESFFRFQFLAPTGALEYLIWDLWQLHVP